MGFVTIRLCTCLSTILSLYGMSRQHREIDITPWLKLTEIY